MTREVKFLNAARPDFDLADAQRIARELYGIEGEAKEFYAERDRTFHLRASDGDEYVLKIVHADEDEATLGEKVVLAPFLEPQRDAIVANLKPID